MPEVGKIIAALGQLLEKLGGAELIAARIDQRAQEVQSRAANNKFRGVADRTGQVRERLTEIRVGLAGVVATVTSAAETTRGVTGQMSPADVVSTLSPVADRISSASTAASGLLAESNRLKGQIETVLRGGRPGPLTAMVDEMKHAVVAAVGGLVVAEKWTNEAIEEARQTGNFTVGVAA